VNSGFDLFFAEQNFCNCAFHIIFLHFLCFLE
jgi:hypothetical protein